MLAAPASGWLVRLDARAVGIAAWRLGAGRARKEDRVSPSAGMLCLAKPGDGVQAGAAAARAARATSPRFGAALAALEGAAAVSDQGPPPPVSPVIEEVGPA